MYLRTREQSGNTGVTVHPNDWFRTRSHLGLEQATSPPEVKLRYFTCSDSDRSEVERRVLQMSVPKNVLREAVKTAASNAVAWLWNAAGALQISPREPRTRELFCQAFGTYPEFV